MICIKIQFCQIELKIRTYGIGIGMASEFLKVYSFENKIRLGENGDGGYVIGDLGSGVYDCYISAGIANEESFSRDFIFKYDMHEYNSFGFDATIPCYPYQYTNKISYIKKNIASYEDYHHTNLSYLLGKYQNIFLKMDIEGYEYPWLLATDETLLKNCKQIAIEFHGINDDTWGCENRSKLACFEKLASTHYLVHAHGNNYSGMKNGVPDVVELTYINKNCFTSTPALNTEPLPSMLDFANNSKTGDYSLNFYPFVSPEN